MGTFIKIFVPVIFVLTFLVMGVTYFVIGYTVFHPTQVAHTLGQVGRNFTDGYEGK